MWSLHFCPAIRSFLLAGTVAAMPNQPLNIVFIIILLIIAAFTGDNTNYFIGRYLGLKVYEKDYRLIKKKYLIKTHNFYEKHGGKTLVIARFMPIIRTFAPFVAGVGTMKYHAIFYFQHFGEYFMGYPVFISRVFFGNIPIVKKNFTLAILAIIFVSLMPMIVAIIKKLWDQYKTRNQK